MDQDYWPHSRLAALRIEQSILPLLHSALQDAVPEIESLHHLEPASDDTTQCVHYTSIAALANILDNRRQAKPSHLRLYDSIHLNDPGEGAYLPKQLAADKRFTWTGRRPDDAAPHHSQSPESAYLTSFIMGDDIKDNLVFWRTYGHEGLGCSLTCSVPTRCLRRVFYGADGASDTIAILAPILDTLTPIIRLTNRQVHRLLAAHIWTSLKGILYLYKSSAYRYEQEARHLILRSHLEPDEIRYEYRESVPGVPRIRHYVERQELEISNILPSGSIVTVGPSVPFPDNIRENLAAMAANADLHGRPELRASTISYRPA